jgi:hypothetical protein
MRALAVQFFRRCLHSSFGVVDIFTERRSGMAKPSEGIYLVNAMGTSPESARRAFASDFTVLSVTTGGDELQVETRAGRKRLGLTEQVDEENYIWLDAAGTFQVTARVKEIHSNEMIFGLAASKTKDGAEEQTDAFVAVKSFEDLKPILPEGQKTEYDIYYAGSTKEHPRQLVVTTHDGGRALQFSFPDPRQSGTVTAKAPRSSVPGRFRTTKSDGDRHLHGFVLAHPILANGRRFRVLVGHALRKGRGDVPNDQVDPYVAVSSNPGGLSFEQE